MNENNSLLKAAGKRADADFETAALAGRVRMMTYVAWVLVTMIVLGIIVFMMMKSPGRVLGVVAAVNAGTLVLLGVIQYCIKILGFRLEGRTLTVRMRVSKPQYDLTGLLSVEVDPQAFKGGMRTFGNGGLGAYSGYFRSKRLGSFTAYVTDMDRAVVLRWENKCVVVSPKDAGYFVEEVCKRTGARRLN